MFVCLFNLIAVLSICIAFSSVAAQSYKTVMVNSEMCSMHRVTDRKKLS